MFHSARLTLTAWYLLIIMLISIFFNAAFYHLGTRELERTIMRTQFRQLNPGVPMPERFNERLMPRQLTLEDLEKAKHQLLMDLVVINSIIFIFAGAAGYFLAGRTLRPIKIMMDDQNTFISHASHELRTPIAVLRAEMEGGLLEKSISEKQARTLLKSSLEELDTLQDLTDDLLRLTKMQSVDDNLNLITLSISEIIKISKAKVEPLAHQKNIAIQIHVKNAKILGDKSSLTELFVIMIENAIKYSPSRSNISILSKNSRNMITISITDEGEGIHVDDAPHIFERFYRSNKQLSTSGHGLGLSIAKKIVEQHGGSISLQRNGKKIGSTFVISLPTIKSSS